MEDSFGLDMIYTVLLASGQLNKAELNEAKATLNKITEIEFINPREQRRIYAIRARIAQMEGNDKEERVQIDKMIDHLHFWSQPKCQSCHASPPDSKVIAHMPITSLWFGERFVELLKKQGEADKIRSAAEADLRCDPNDEKVRILLAYALQAQGRSDEEAMKHFRELPWAQFPEREIVKPRMMTTFP